MTTNKRKKVVKYRGSKTHGGGAMKKRRGAGHRGGRGAAGSGKRADAKKPSIWKARYFGKFGFISRNPEQHINAINIKEIEIKLPLWIKEGLVSEKDGCFEIDLSVLGYDKLLSTGTATKKLRIKTRYYSPKAEEKIKKAGGDIIS